MKKIVASVGAAALGISAVQNATAAGVGTVDPSKAWSVSAALRGFYDDNYTTSPKGSEQDSVGFSVNPSIAINLPMEQSTFGARYTYGAYWYQDRADQTQGNSWDQSHQLDAVFDHNFSERYSLNATESFVLSQEPGLLNDLGNPYRTEGDNLRNNAQVNFTGALTRQLSYVLGYQNTYYNYDNENGTVFQPSLSALLDRMEQLGLVNLRWQALPQTVLVLGYNYGVVDYSSDEFILGPIPPYTTPQTSEVRNNRSHYIYAGFDQNFSKSLLLSVRGGVQLVDYYNDLVNDSATSPYGQLNLSYMYLPGSSVQVGWTLSHNATDIAQVDPTTGSITTDQLSSVLYAALNHKFDAKWSGKLNASWQSSEFNNGLYDGQVDNFFDVGVGLAYQFNRNLSGEIGYNYYVLNSDLPNRDYDRNRIFLGIVASY